MAIFTLQSSGPPVRVVYGGDGATLIVNRDLVNQVIYGDQSIVGDNSNSYSIIDPLGSITVDGQSDVYALGLSGNPTINVTNGAASWTPSPAQIAAQINALGIPETTAAYIATGSAGGIPGGVPLLKFTNNLGNANAVNVPANSNVNLLTKIAFTQPSYEGVFVLNLPAGLGTIPFMSVIFNWFDSVSGFNIDSKFFIITAGNGGPNQLQFYFSGPARGNQLSVSVTNLDPAQAMTLNWSLNQTSHLHNHDHMLQTVFELTAPIGYTNPAGTPGLGVLMDANPTVAASSTVTRLTAAYAGRATFSVDSPTAGVALVASLIDPVASGNGLYGNPNSRYPTFRLTGQSANQEVILPNGPMLLQLVNTSSTTAVTPNCSLIAGDY